MREAEQHRAGRPSPAASSVANLYVSLNAAVPDQSRLQIRVGPRHPTGEEHSTGDAAVLRVCSQELKQNTALSIRGTFPPWQA